MKITRFFYPVIFFAVCILPLAAMPFAGEEDSLENRSLAAFPSLTDEEGNVNAAFLSGAGAYFQDHFAFRSAMVTVNALLRGKLFGVSADDKVIQGTDGWLYYQDSLDDYLGRNLLSKRSLFNIAHTLSIVQDSLESQGIRFLFTVAANKNSLYGEHMPCYDNVKITEENNLTRLVPLLKEEGVHYLDLKEIFQEQEEVLYHKRDSHWNNKGAALAADRILDALGKSQDPYEEGTYTVRKDFIGDLDKMLYPGAVTPEEEIYYDRMLTYAYVGEVESNFDPKITTVNPVLSGSLVMYRDSFGNTLLPFLADAYADAYFSRVEPFQLYSDLDMSAADAVVVERAERFLPDLAANPPVMPAPAVDEGELSSSAVSEEGLPTPAVDEGGLLSPAVDEGELSSSAVSEEGLPTPAVDERGWPSSAVHVLDVSLMDPFEQITGWLSPEYAADNSRVYVRINGDVLYEAFPATLSEDGTLHDTGFVLYLYPDELPQKENEAEFIVETDGNYELAGKAEIPGFPSE